MGWVMLGIIGLNTSLSIYIIFRSIFKSAYLVFIKFRLEQKLKNALTYVFKRVYNLLTCKTLSFQGQMFMWKLPLAEAVI
jgi:hypothetical protein